MIIGTEPTISFSSFVKSLNKGLLSVNVDALGLIDETSYECLFVKFV